MEEAWRQSFLPSLLGHDLTNLLLVFFFLVGIVFVIYKVIRKEF